MAEYIDRMKVRIAIIDTKWICDQDEDVAYDMIDSIPSADVEEVRHGRWLGTHDGLYYSYSCSECGAEALTEEETMHDQVCSAFCPNCGAKMDGWCCSECKTLGSPQWKRCPVCEAKMYGGKENG